MHCIQLNKKEGAGYFIQLNKEADLANFNRCFLKGDSLRL